jgi:hypothetical protein
MVGGDALKMADAIGIEILDEAQCHALQEQDEFDGNTSRSIRMPDPLRALGGARLCDRSFDRMFTYHNGAESYYAARGFRWS